MRNLCDRCYSVAHEELQAYSAKVDRDRLEHRQRQQWAADVGMTPEQVRHVAYFAVDGEWFGEDWSGFRIEFIGLPINPSSWPPPWPFWRLGPTVHQIWARRITREGWAPFMEGRWHPDLGERVSLHGLEGIGIGFAKNVVTAFLRLLPHTDQRANNGRDEGTGNYPTRESFARALTEAAERLRKQDIKPTPDLMANELWINKRQIYNLIRKFDLSDLWRKLTR